MQVLNFCEVFAKSFDPFFFAKLRLSLIHEERTSPERFLNEIKLKIYMPKVLIKIIYRVQLVPDHPKSLLKTWLSIFLTDKNFLPSIN